MPDVKIGPPSNTGRDSAWAEKPGKWTEENTTRTILAAEHGQTNLLRFFVPTLQEI